MKTLNNIAAIIATTALVQIPAPAKANDEAIGAFIGGMLGAAIGSQESKARPTARAAAPARSSAEIAEARMMQESLNYFGFPAGTPDGIIGSGTRNAISQYQMFMGFAPSGNILPHERNFLITAYNRAAMEPLATIQQAMRNPMGLRTLLQSYAQVDPSPPPVVAVQPAAAPPVAAPAVVAPVSVQASSTVVVENGMSDEEAQALQDEVNNLADQIALLRAVIEHQQQNNTGGEDTTARVAAVQAMLVSYTIRMEEVEEVSAVRYTTPIRPQNQNLGNTARRISEIFPKIPYYIAGTDEIGEMWIEPVVTDDGFLQFGFNFIDPLAAYDPVRDQIRFAETELPMLSEALSRVHEWTEVAQTNGVRRNFARRVVCLPDGLCDQRISGVSSSEVVFQIYEDGSTAARLQRNRGAFSSGYNMSVESGLLLAAYLDYMHQAGLQEFKTGTMTEDDLNALFE